jgi:hypothetical protein
MYQELLTQLRTKQEVLRLLEEVEMLLESLYEDSGRGFDRTLASQVRAWVSDAISDEINKNEVDKKSYLMKLKKKLSSLKEVKLALAFEPSSASIDKFSSFIKKNVGEEVVMDLSYEPKLIGGTTLSYDGEYRDFSINRFFEQDYKKNKKMVLELLERQT